MAFELRGAGITPAQFATERDAIAAAERILRADPDAELDLIDLETGQPATPAASAGWREELKRRFGF